MSEFESYCVGIRKEFDRNYKRISKLEPCFAGKKSVLRRN